MALFLLQPKKRCAETASTDKVLTAEELHSGTALQAYIHTFEQEGIDDFVVELDA
jgi:hypothetical protein